MGLCIVLKYQNKYQQSCIPFWGTRGESVSLLIQIVGKFQFLVVLELWSPFLCQLLVEAGSQLIKATPISCLVDPFLDLQSQQWQVEYLSWFESHLFFHCHIFLTYTSSFLFYF